MEETGLGKTIRGTTESFIEKAKEVHGDRYDYSLVDYKNSKTTVKILCPKHGVFEQSPGAHTAGQGCIKCCKRHQYSTEEFIEEVTKVHKGRYGYSNTVYTTTKGIIEVQCPVHGAYLQKAREHMNGHGCRKCAGNTKKTTAQVVAEFKVAHGSLYDYSRVVYNGKQMPVEVLCKKHGSFFPTPSNHLKNKSGCPKCNSYERVTKDVFLSRAQVTHGGLFDYSLVGEITTKKQSVDIICKTHGVFRKQVERHLLGQGCPKCATSGYRSNLPGTIYLLQADGLLKVGITNRTVSERVRDINRESCLNFVLVRSWEFNEGATPANVEQVALCLFRMKYKNPNLRFAGFTETFISDDVNHFISTLESIIDSLK